MKYEYVKPVEGEAEYIRDGSGVSHALADVSARTAAEDLAVRCDKAESGITELEGRCDDAEYNIKRLESSMDGANNNITALYTELGFVREQAEENRADIDVLNGDGEGSVEKTVTDRIAEVVANAPEDLNTLKEIAEWITNHKDSASEMNAGINTNSAAIEKLEQEKADKEHTHSDYKGCTDDMPGIPGFVPKCELGGQNYVLHGDGSWDSNVLSADKASALHMDNNKPVGSANVPVYFSEKGIPIACGDSFEDIRKELSALKKEIESLKSGDSTDPTKPVDPTKPTDPTDGDTRDYNNVFSVSEETCESYSTETINKDYTSESFKVKTGDSVRLYISYCIATGNGGDNEIAPEEGYSLSGDAFISCLGETVTVSANVSREQGESSEEGSWSDSKEHTFAVEEKDNGKPINMNLEAQLPQGSKTPDGNILGTIEELEASLTINGHCVYSIKTQ